MNIISPVFLDPKSRLAKALGIEEIPVFLVAKNGIIVAVEVGVLHDLKRWLIAEVRKHSSDGIRDIDDR